MEKKKRIMIIGLDGSTFDLIKPWSKEGKLPTFKKLLKDGVHGDLRSTIPHATIPAWPSFATGCNPGKHGLYDFFKEKKSSYDLTVEINPSRAIKKPTIWKILGDYGHRVAVINVPATYPPSKINGYMIAGMLTPPKAKYTFPPEFQKELNEKIGEYKIFFQALSAKNPKVLLNDLKKTLEMRVKAVEYLWNEKKPDFLMMVDNGTDRSEHELWKYLDKDNPLYDKNMVEKYGNPLLKYYEEVDRSLARILKLIDEGTILILMSDHGQGSLRKFVNLNMFLIKEGYMKIKKSPISKIKYSLFKLGFTPKNIYELLRKMGMERYASDRISAKTKLSILNKTLFSTIDIDWSRTKAFSSGVTGSITINLEGRQPNGCVSSKNQYESIVNEIIQELNLLVDNENNNKIIKKVYRKEEIYTGPYLDQAPDIVAIPEEYYEFFGMHGFTFNKMLIKTFGNSGSHRENGIFMAVGKDIKSSLKIKEANIIDIAPTILYITGIFPPDYMDGKVLYNIFNENSEFSNGKRKLQKIDIEKVKIKELVKKLKKI